MRTSTIASERSEARFLEVVSPERANSFGTLDGAAALFTMAQTALQCATHHARCPVAMAKADSIEFVRAILAGSTIDVRARVVFQGLSSMTVIVEIAPHNPGAQDETAYISGRFMIVAVDASGIPVRIPDTEARPAAHG